ncbi:MAG: hypothetical protein IPL65_11565 [Lewinellaceae bacterium]|nr:hypothetical protein [Lewinellaceae bacterium]
MNRYSLPYRLFQQAHLLLQDPRIWLFILSISLISLGAVEEASLQAQQTPLFLP